MKHSSMTVNGPAPQSAKDRVKALIRPYIKSQVQPPFSDLQMMAAVLFLEGKQLTLEKIVEKIIANFLSFRTQLVQATMSESPCGGIYVLAPFENALRDYDFFLRDIRRVHIPATFSVSKATIKRIFSLDPYYPPVAKTALDGSNPSKLFDLPPEIRNRIYGMVFTYPKSGLRPRKVCRMGYRPDTSEFQLLSRDMDHEADVQMWDQQSVRHPNSESDIRSKPVHIELALAHTNRQIFQEALPIFYNNNRFHCIDVVELKSFLSHVPQHGRDGIGEISFNYVVTQRYEAAAAFHLLRGLKALKKLHIIFNETDWTAYKRNDMPRYAHPSDYKGMRKLTRITTLKELVLVGDCDDLAKYIFKTMKPNDASFRMVVNGAEAKLEDGEVVFT